MNKTPQELLHNINLLYVEDDINTAEAMQRYLQKRVKTLHMCHNGEYGLELFKNKNIDIVITDIKMPYMNGIEMAKAIKKIKKDVKIIFVSAYHEDDLFLQAINLGADGFLIKPISAANALMPVLQKAASSVFKDKMLAEYTKTLRLILDYVESMVVVTDGKEVFNANLTFLRFLGYESIKQYNQNIASFDTLLQPKEGFISGQNWLQDAATNSNNKVMIHGAVFLLKLKPIDALRSSKYIINLTDITSLESEKTDLIRNASKDVVTRLINRDSFQQIYNRQLRHLKQTQNTFAIASLLVSNLDMINKEYSYEKADAVLRQVALYLSKTKKIASVTRWGGGKFILLLWMQQSNPTKTFLEELKQMLLTKGYGGVAVEIEYNYSIVQTPQSLQELIEKLKNSSK
ncbi:MAG: response regulator [Campylobacterota bacterium]